jgi:hypothetical protein
VETVRASSAIEVHESPADPGSAGLEQYVDEKQMTLREAMSKYDLVDVVHDPANGSYVVMAERPEGWATAKRLADRYVNRPGSGASPDHFNPGFDEMGFVSPSPFTSWTREEWNPKLRDQMGIREYYKMKRADGIVRGALRLLKTPIEAGRWFVKPGSTSSTDKKIASFVEKNLFSDLNVTWSTLLGDILLMCDYGHIAFEKVWTKNKKGQIVLQKLAPRHPLDIQEWRYDRHGGPDGCVMYPTEANGFFDGASGSMREIFIPISKLAVFALEPEAGDMRGISVLRSAYKHYFYKDTLYKIDAIQKERHGIGVPVIKLPPGFSDADKRLADQLGRNLRTNERAHVVLPPNWELIFAALEGQPVDCIKSIDHHNMQIMANILAPFLEDSSVDPKSTDMFLKSTRYIGMTICDIFNKFIIPELVDLNFTLGADREYPTLHVRRVGEQEDLRTMSFTIRNMVGADVIRPDDPLEDFMRFELDLPPRDEKTSRYIDPLEMAEAQNQNEGDDGNAAGGTGQSNTPQKPQPGRTGLPRQAAKPQMNAGTKSSGNDKSGG